MSKKTRKKKKKKKEENLAKTIEVSELLLRPTRPNEPAASLPTLVRAGQKVRRRCRSRGVTARVGWESGHGALGGIG